MRGDVFGKRDGSIARVHEFPALLIRGCPTKPRLGILQGVEGAVPDSGYAGDLVPLPLAVASGSFPPPRDRVLLLLDPAVFDVAGQVSLLVEGETVL
jgi:hypothetical protein